MSERKERPPVPEKILALGIDLIDLEILSGVLNGKTYETIAENLGISRRTVLARLEDLEEKEVIVKGKRQIPLIDGIKLWNHVFITYVKLHLPSAVPYAARPVGPGLTRWEPSPPPPGWFDALKEIKRDNPLFDKLVRYAFSLIGTEYDMIFVITCQSVDEYADFFRILQGKTGIIEKVWGTRIIESAGYHYDPIRVPDPKDVEKALAWTKKSSDRALGKQE